MTTQHVLLHQNWPELLARWVSLLLSPLVLWPLYFWLYLTYSQLPADTLKIGGLIVFGVGVFPSIATLIYLKKTKLISDWDIRQKGERHRLNLIVLTWGLVTLVLLALFKLTIVLKLGLVILLWCALFTGVTFFWKISAHASTIMLVTLLVSQKINSPLWLGIPAVALVSWSRIYRQNHTFLEVVGGIVLSCFIYLIAKLGNFV